MNGGTGLYRRFRVGVVVFAVLVALAGAYLGAAAGDRMGLGLAADLPSGAAAGRLSATVFPGLRVWGGKPAEVIVSQPDGDGIEYGWSDHWVRHTGATRDVATYSAGARDRLAAAGWTIHDFEVGDPEADIDGGNTRSAGFWASRPGMVLHFDDYLLTGFRYYDTDGGASYSVRRDDRSAHVFDWVGGALGAIVAAMLFGYVHRRVGSTPAGVAAAAALLFLLPAVLVSEPPDPPGKAPWWNGLGSEFGAAPAILAAITAGILLLAAVFHGGGRPFAFVVRRKRPLAAGLLVVVVGFTAYEILNDRSVTEPPCHPAAGVPAAPAASVVGDSDRVHVYLDPRATPDQRNLVVAAMRRSNALAEEAELIWQPGSAEFKKQYCGGGRVASDAVAGLPYFFSARLDYAPDFPAFLDEVGNQAAVLSVQRVPA